MWRWALILALCWGCGSNLYESMVASEHDDYYLEEARLALADRNYTKAGEQLDKVKTQDVEWTLLRVSTDLGAAGLSLWQILLNLIDGNAITAGSSGVDSLFNALSDTVFGTSDEERTARLGALSSSITRLQGMSNPTSRTNNFRCFLSGILALPSINDGTTQITAAMSALTNLGTTISNTSSGCPDLSELDEATASIETVRANLSLVLQSISGCTFLEGINTGTGELNAIEAMLSQFISTADAGCVELPTCTNDLICEALASSCVRDSLSAGDAVAGDGVIAQCEILQNCRDGGCF